MKSLIISIIAICFCSVLIAQKSWAIERNKNLEIRENETLEQLEQDSTSNITSNLNIVADPRINELLEMHREENSRRKGIEGFRIQIYSGSGDNSKQEAYKIKASFLSFHPNVEVYIVFQAPEFKVRVGNFRDRSEALALKAKIQNQFPNPFIVEDFISFPNIVVQEEESVTE